MSAVPLTPEQITTESFRMIEAEVGPHPFDALEWPIVRRMIHASGDLEYTRLVHFHRDAARAGVQALQAGAPLVTDVRMVASGIQRAVLEQLGSTVHCFIDAPDVARMAQEQRTTRSACAMQKAVAEVGPAVYVIGNAPTALLTLCALTQQGHVQPPVILAMPVGFVAVVESKEQALTLDVPVITVRGRKGGSAVATATVNALLLLAQQG
ncbi:MAG: precorrin-8X methylmutase [Candidatus Tectomicrobia bacterium]|uniref:Precorrin-8X methylmutase n=1 Tax=Tectimicrobiota bacterium TaxID=2528274 RepID=A0A937W5W0_UNCTE|nr:precorrin-8X methylmutase [Candidatus Tectomicrobia bacterium]